MDISYFMDNKSPGAFYLSKAVEELNISVTKETTILELYGIFNGMFARALDLLIDDLKKSDVDIDKVLFDQ